MKKIVYFIILWLTACTNPVQEENDLSSLKVFDDSIDELVFKSIELTKLETGQDFLVGDRIKLKINDGEFFIANELNHKCVFRFDSSGKFINYIGKLGRGVEEYANFRDLTIHGDTVDILSSHADKSKISGYTRNGDFLYSITIDLIAISFEKVSSGYIISTGYNKAHHPHRFYITDKDGNIKNSFLKNNYELNLPVIENSFFKSGNTVYIKEAFNNSVYMYTSGELEKSYSLDFFEYSIPEIFFNKPMMEGFSMINEKGFANIKGYYENNKNAVFEILVQQDGKDTQIYQIILDKKESKLYRNSFSENQPVTLKHLHTITSHDELVFLIYPIDIVENRESFNVLPLLNGSILDNINVDDNPLVAFCKIKKK